MNIQEAIDHLRSIRYKPGYTITAEYNYGGQVVFHLRARLPDSSVPEIMVDVHLERKWHVEDLAFYKPEMLTKEVIELIKGFEMYEWLHVGKVQFFNPHGA